MRNGDSMRMKLRHAAVLALVGWYLMMPPIESCLGAFSGGSCEQTPLAKWQIRVTRDSLEECEKSKAVWIEKGRMYLGESDARSRTRGLRMAPNEADFLADTEAICVATDDPRLKNEK